MNPDVILISAGVSLVVAIVTGWSTSRFATRQYRQQQTYSRKVEVYGSVLSSSDKFLTALNEANRAELEAFDRGFDDLERARFIASKVEAMGPHMEEMHDAILHVQTVAAPGCLRRLMFAYKTMVDSAMAVDTDDPKTMAEGTDEGKVAQAMQVVFRQVVLAEARRDIYGFTFDRFLPSGVTQRLDDIVRSLDRRARHKGADFPF